MVVKMCIDIVWEVIREDHSYGRDSMVGEGKASLCCDGSRSVHKRAFGTENGDVCCYGSTGGHWRSEILALGRGDKDVIGVHSDILMEWGEEEGIENFLSYMGRSGRHC